MGLHVDRSNSGSPANLHETHRRLWYSAYVLDRLLSLQLGRPAAIQDVDYFVTLPTPLPNEQRVLRTTTMTGIEAHTIDYFLSVIQLSHIIGRVIRDLYGPKAIVGDLIDTVSSLDHDLLLWRSQLKRKLRFDLGHIIETSEIFQKQVSTSRKSFLW